MMPYIAKSALAVACMTVFTSAQAVQLGQLNVTSAPEENFAATLSVLDSKNVKGELVVTLAQQEAYTRMNLQRAPMIQGLRLALASRDPLQLSVTSSVPLQTKQMPLLVELHDGDQVILRQYTINAGTKGAIHPVKPAALAMSEAMAAEKSMQKTQVTSATKPVPQKENVKPTQAQSAKAPTPLTRLTSTDTDKSVLVQPGMSPWSLGVHFQKLYPEAGVQQVLVALAKHNPAAFPEGTVTYLLPGETVHAPTKAEVMAVSLDDAKRIVNQGLRVADVKTKPKTVTEKTQKSEPKKPVIREETHVEKKAPVVKQHPVTKPTPVSEKVHQSPKAETQQVQNAVTAQSTKPQVQTQTSQTVVEQQKSAETKPAEVLTPSGQVTPQVLMPVPATSVPETTTVTPQATTQDVLTTNEPEADTMVPNMDIITEETQVEPEESGSGWLWMMLALLVAAGAGFVYYKKSLTRRQQEAFTSSLRSRTHFPQREPSMKSSTASAGAKTAAAETITSMTGAAVATSAQPSMQTSGEMPPVKAATESVTPMYQTSTMTQTQSTQQVTPAVQTQEQAPMPTYHMPDFSAKDNTKANVFDMTDAMMDDREPEQKQPEQPSMLEDLEMARTLLQAGSDDQARALLYEVLDKGTQAEQHAAREILAAIKR